LAAKPKIACLPNGPYQLVDEAGAGTLRRASGETLPAARASLCRCGGSKKKPFCDGTHKTNGFSDRNLADPKKNRRQAYAGKGITIFDNRALCAHAGFCTDELASVFRHHDNPWIVPDAAETAKVIDVIRKCPSGALSYAVDGAEAAPPQRAPMVTVTDNGPYAVTGGVELLGVKMGEGASSERYTLCRCGASKNKPFCDGSHWDAGFKDPT
jgi:CDGSH-type Zn-finger protein/ferredoxin